MADAVKNFIRKGKASVSTKYSPLAQQDASEDEEDEDDILYIHDGLRDNGFTSINMPQTNGQRDSIELRNLGARPLRSDLDTIQKKPWTPRRKLIFVLSVIICVFVTLICVFAIPWNNLCCSHGSLNLSSEQLFNSTVLNSTDFTPSITVEPSTASPVINDQQVTPSKKPGKPHSTHKRTDQWTFSRKGFASESCVRLIDVDEDGKDDVVISTGMGIDYHLVATIKDPIKICEVLGLEAPCLGQVIALRGSDGQVLWNISVTAEIFLFNCEGIDINKDGMKDCIGGGRMGSLVAFNPKNGDVFWTEHALKGMLNRAWNIYQPLVLNKDLDGDGVREVVIAHGGEPSFLPQVHDRNPGRLILLSGATGEPIGRYLDMPNRKETYMSPVLHVNADTGYVLFGSGGETVEGAFMAISVNNLYNYAMQKEVDKTGWGRFALDSNGIIEIHKTKTKGVMVPPLLVDMNKDGILDILMVTFDGTYILYNGKNLEIMWQREIKDTETYSTAAPGYFNDDDTLDFMIHCSPGSWPYYDYSVSLILDGRSGSILWQMSSGHYDMTSDLVLRTKEQNRDAFVFRVQGREGPNYENPAGVFHDVIAQRPISSGRKRRETHPDSKNPFGFAGIHAQAGNQRSQVPLNIKEGGHSDNRQDAENPYGNYYGDSGQSQPRQPGGYQGTQGQVPAAHRPQPSGSGQYGSQPNYNLNGQRNQPYNSYMQPSGSQRGPQIRLPTLTEGRQSQAGQNIPNLSEGRQQYIQQSGSHQGPQVRYPSLTEGKQLQGRQNVPNLSEGGHQSPPQLNIPNQGYASNQQQYPVQQGTNMARNNPISHGIVEGGHGNQETQAKDSQLEDLQKLVNEVQDGQPIPVFDEQKIEEEEQERKHKAEMECQRNKLSYRVEVFVMDRTTMRSPLIIDSMDMYTYTYNLTKDDMMLYTSDLGLTPSDLEMERKNFNYGPFCSLIRPKEITTGAIGDVDGDGLPDLVLLVVYQGFLHAEDGSNIRMVQDIKVYKINLEETIRLTHHKSINATISALMPSQSNEKSLQSLQFLPVTEQPWTSYMGARGNGAYHP
ncbi:uncharacterized protein LOC135486131 isoform X2 [Lineus longissimus]|uniref:uncharacterized protein LOC135486131 isoform X2 n=1 Tax=Lineus longissimus TaxID=88925 RepID=UPI00315D2521